MLQANTAISSVDMSLFSKPVAMIFFHFIHTTQLMDVT